MDVLLDLPGVHGVQDRASECPVNVLRHGHAVITRLDLSYSQRGGFFAAHCLPVESSAAGTMDSGLKMMRV